MKTLSWQDLTLLTLALAAVLAVEPAKADSPTDTSGWKCTQCPFLDGYESEAEAGLLSASGANASYGRYTGIDHGGTYVDAGGSGQMRGDDGSYASYDLSLIHI